MRTFLFSFILFFGLSISTYVFAEVKYTPIVGVPRIDGNELSTEAYVNAIYFLAITIAALLAIVKIIFAGVKYVLSDVVTDKGNAIKDIQGALLGLLIVLSAVLILNTINPNLKVLNIFANAPSLETIERSKSVPPSVAVGQSIVVPSFMHISDRAKMEGDFKKACVTGVVEIKTVFFGDGKTHTCVEK